MLWLLSRPLGAHTNVIFHIPPCHETRGLGSRLLEPRTSRQQDASQILVSFCDICLPAKLISAHELAGKKSTVSSSYVAFVAMMCPRSDHIRPRHPILSLILTSLNFQPHRGLDSCKLCPFLRDRVHF